MSRNSHFDNAAPSGQWRYDAFISYRHTEPDRKWAKWLHTALETYRVPRAALRQGVSPRLKRVFRDEEELPASSDLNNQIEQALQASRFLIVICSPRTPASRWVNREVERFRELGRHDRILALLIEGEPSDSFPSALREIRRTVVDAHGAAREQIEEVEPLAADVRTSRTESQRHLARMALLRIMACIVGVRFDDLRRREQERRSRRFAYLSVGGAILALIMAGLALVALLQRNEANRQRGIAQENERQAIVARRQAQKRLAESLVSQGDVYASSGRWTEASRSIQDAFAAYGDAQEQPFAAELALWQLQLSAPAPLNRTFAPRMLGRGAVAFSTDGKLAAALKDDESLAIWDLQTARMLRELGNTGGRAYAADFSRDRKHLITSHHDHTVRVWDVATGKLLRTLKGHTDVVRCVAFFPDNRRAVSGGDDGVLYLWDIETDDFINTLRGLNSPVLSLSVSSNGNAVIFGGQNGKVAILDLTKKQTTLLDTLDAPVTGVDLAADQRAAVAVAGAETILWDIASQRRERTFTQPQVLASGAKFNPKEVLARAVFSSDGDRLLRASGDSAVVQVIRGLAPNRTLAGHEDVVEAMGFAAGETLALAASRDKSVLAWPVDSDRESRVLKHGSPVYSADVSKNDLLALTGGANGTVRVWDAFTGKLLRSFTVTSDRVISVAFSPDATKALIASDNRNARLIDLASGDTIREFAGHTDGLNGVVFSPDGSLALTASKDQTVKLWKVSTGETLRTFAAHAAEAIAVSFSANGRSFLSCGGDRKVILWNVESDKPAAVFSGHENRVRTVTFARDGAHFLSGSDDGTMRLWNISSGQPILTIKADPVAVCGVAFSPDGRLLFSAGASKSLRLWDAASGREWRSIKGFEQSVWSVALSGDGLICLAGGNEGIAVLSDFSTTVRQREIEPRLKSAVDALANRADDPDALKTLGEWYALRGVWPWAIEFLDRARAAGAKPSPLLLGRCHWMRGDSTAAIAEFKKAMDAKEVDESYLKICLQKLNEDAAK